MGGFFVSCGAASLSEGLERGEWLELFPALALVSFLTRAMNAHSFYVQTRPRPLNLWLIQRCLTSLSV